MARVNEEVGTLAEELQLLAAVLAQNEGGRAEGFLRSIRQHLQAADGDPSPEVQRIDIS